MGADYGGPLKFSAHEATGWGPTKVLLHIGIGHNDGTVSIAEPLVFKSYPRGALLPDEPALHLNEIECRALMDQLWRLGVRPTDNREQPETTGAMKEHLADLRRLIFEKRVK